MRPTTEELRERVVKAINHQKRPTVTVLSSLLAVQDELGYIPDEAMEEVATLMDTTITGVWGVASFYPNFRFTPPGNHTVEVCWGPTCHLTGASHVLQSVLDELGLEGQGDTEDHEISFKFNTCLGACSRAPLMSIDHHMVGNLTPEAAVERIRSLRQTD
ncbi:MAG: NAD(P)H-dependent oxidoreductase subunit E [SAR202 cluster bacterium]|nr:NAD(P)H-dependent oxidoreductase subunit E [SAR202 cluster bacterium]MDP6513683.1 NAD(P)H-dependent oxidoreductase subunit E [SAR202 cluster bacterium]MDP6713978.1 NAD(P)H-dependent oxidoreductase subunit E [SAR202 cluster bacterium]